MSTYILKFFLPKFFLHPAAFIPQVRPAGDDPDAPQASGESVIGPVTPPPPTSLDGGGTAAAFLWWPVVVSIVGAALIACVAFFIVAGYRRRRRHWLLENGEPWAAVPAAAAGAPGMVILELSESEDSSPTVSASLAR